MARAGPDGNQEPGASSRFPIWMQRPKHLGHWQGAGLEVEQPGFELVSVWDSSVTGTAEPAML